MKLIYLTFFALLFGLGLAFASGISTPIPSPTATNPKTFWRSFMSATYGSYDKRQKCWVSSDSTGNYCMRPHTIKTVDVSGRKQIFATVAGAIISKEGNDCHACNGSIGLFVLDASNKIFDIIAQSGHYRTDGSNGRAAAKEAIKVRLIGPNSDYWFGWL